MLSLRFLCLYLALAFPFSAFADTHLSNLRLIPAGPSLYPPGSSVSVIFDYETDTEIRVRLLPIINGAMFPAQPVLPNQDLLTGSGTSFATFQMPGPLGREINEIMLFATTEDQTRYLWWIRLPVTIVAAPGWVSVDSINPQSPAILKLEEETIVTLNYSNLPEQGIRLWAQARNAVGNAPGGMAFQPSGLLTGSGQVTRSFKSNSIQKFDAAFVRIAMRDEATDEIYEFRFPVDIRYNEVRFRSFLLRNHIFWEGEYNFDADYATESILGLGVRARPIRAFPQEVLSEGFTVPNPGVRFGDGTYSSSIDMEEFTGPISGVEIELRRGLNGPLLDIIRFPLPSTWSAVSPVEARNVVVEPAVHNLPKIWFYQPKAQTIGTIPVGQEVFVDYGALSTSPDTNYTAIAQMTSEGSPLPGSNSAGTTFFPNQFDGKEAWLRADQGGHVDAIRITSYPVGDFNDQERDYHPIDLTIQAEPEVSIENVDASGDDFTVIFAAFPGFNHRVWSSPDLSEWTPVGEWFPGTGGLDFFTDLDIQIDFDRYFYRLQVASPAEDL